MKVAKFISHGVTEIVLLVKINSHKNLKNILKIFLQKLFLPKTNSFSSAYNSGRKYQSCDIAFLSLNLRKHDRKDSKDESRYVLTSCVTVSNRSRIFFLKITKLKIKWPKIKILNRAAQT